MYEVLRLRRYVAHQRVGVALLCMSSVEIFSCLFENTKLFLAFVINCVLINDISNLQVLLLHIF